MTMTFCNGLCYFDIKISSNILEQSKEKYVC